MKQQRRRSALPGVWRAAAGRIARALGALQLAVCLLPTLAIVLFLGTVVESRHGRPAAAQLVYQTWWFVLLLGLLATNIFFAAAKKWPWQRHQTGFIITHIGLLTLIAGGVTDSLFGTTGAMSLVTAADTPAAAHLSQRSAAITDRTVQRLKVRRPQRSNPETLDADLTPGPLPWGMEEGATTRIDTLTAFLAWLRDPLPDGWSRDLGEGARLELLTYYPHARLEHYGPADDGRSAFPALKFQLASPTTGPIGPRWVACTRLTGGMTYISPGRVDFLGDKLQPEQIAEFSNPTTAPPLGHQDDLSVRAVLQFVTDSAGKLHYRSFTSSRGAGLTFEGAGQVDPSGDWRKIWAGMDWRFRVTQFLPRASNALHCTPVDRPAAAEAIEPPAIRCRLTNGPAAEEFWLAGSDGDWSTVIIGGERFELGYHSTRYELGFDLTLLRAERTTDAGSGKPAGLSSFVLLNDPAQGIRDEPRVITLNDPLGHRGYRIYQGGIVPLGPDDSGKPVHRVQFLANRDPGVWMKYTGSAMVALGIACMFYMRAYFFKRRDAAAATVA